MQTGGSRLTRLVGWMVGILGVAAVAVVGANIVKVGRDVDARAMEREAKAIDHGLRLLGEFAAGDLLAFSQWDEALREIVDNASLSWMKENLGPDVFQAEDDVLLVIDAHGTALFASDSGERPDDSSGREAVEAAAHVLARSSAIYEKALAEDLYLDDRYGDGLYYGIYAHDIARIAGVPSLVVSAPLVGDDEGVEVPDTPTSLLEILALTPDMLGRLGALAHLDGIELLEDGRTAGGPVHIVRNGQGVEVARLTWTHMPPGTAILRSAGPALALSLLGFGGLLWLVSRVLRRNALALAASEQAALHASRHDPATKLANRGWFFAEFDRIVSGGGDGQSYVIVVDCDHFKSINDTLGHAAGDAVLLALAMRLRGLDETIQIAARLGGDEFAAIAMPVSSPDECEWLLCSMTEKLSRPVTFEGETIAVSVSIGAALVEHGVTLRKSMARADLALYRAKRDGRGCFRIYDPRIDDAAAPSVPPVERRSGSRQAA